MTLQAYTGEQLIESIHRLGMSPNNTEGTEDADILAHINEAMKVMISEFTTIREEYFIKREKVALGTGAKYRIPHRAYLNKLRDIAFWNSSGDRKYLQKIPLELVYRYNNTGASEPEGFCVEGNDILLLPDNATSFTGYLEFVYMFRPGQLVLSTECRQINYVDTANGIVSFASDVPSTWSTDNQFDIHSGSSGAEIKCWDLDAFSVSGSVMVFDSPISGETFGTSVPVVGDWVCLSEECALPGLPQDWHAAIVRATCVRLAEAEGDGQAFQIHQASHTDEKKKHFKAMENRVESKPLKIKGHNSILRAC